MRIRLLATDTLACVPLAALAQQDNPTGLTLDLEGGAVASSRNQARIPNEGGTRFDLRELTGTAPEAYGRLALTWQFAAHHALRLTAAPLELSGSKVLDQDVVFEGSTFLAGAETRAAYQFSNYRLTYRYDFSPGERWQWGLGGTLFVRDAAITLRQGALEEVNDDVGLVPLLHVRGERRLGARTALVLDVDGAVAPQGRAIDATVRVERSFGRGLTVGLGYRGLEGGADNDDVYNFAWLHYAALTVGWQVR